MSRSPFAGFGRDSDMSSRSFDKQYLDEHTREMSVEEYIQAMDQRVNLKVA